MTVPTPRAPHGTAHWPQLAKTAALKGVNPAASSMGALMTTATPKPVTDSKKGATPTTTPAASATRSGSSLPEKPRHFLYSPARREQVVQQQPPEQHVEHLGRSPDPPEQRPGYRIGPQTRPHQSPQHRHRQRRGASPRRGPPQRHEPHGGDRERQRRDHDPQDIYHDRMFSTKWTIRLQAGHQRRSRRSLRGGWGSG